MPIFNYEDSSYYYNEIPMDPSLMDLMFCREDNLFFQSPDFVKVMSDQEKKELILFIKEIIADKLTKPTSNRNHYHRKGYFKSND